MIISTIYILVVLFTKYYYHNILLLPCNILICFLFLLIAVKQDDENQSLKSRLKDTEEEKTRLQRTISVQQSQNEKYKMLSQEANKKSEGLQQEVIALGKVLQILVSFISWKGKKASNHPLRASFAD